MSGTRKQAAAGGLFRDGNAALIFAVTVLTATSLSAITPALPAVQAACELNAMQTGVLITIFAAPSVVIAPLLGILADRLSRKRVLTWSLVLYGLAGGACAFAATFPQLLVLRFLQGIPSSALYSLGVAIISDGFQGPDRTRAFAFDSAASGLGAALFPLLGGVLAPFSWRYPFALAFLTLPLGLHFARRFNLPDVRRALSFRPYLQDLQRQLRHRAVLGNLVLSFLLSFILVGAFFSYLPQSLEVRFGASALLIGVIFAVRAASVAGVSLLLAGSLSSAVALPLVRYAAVLAAVALTLIPLLPGVWWQLLPAVLFGIAYGVLLTSLELLLADATPASEHAVFLSLQTGASGLGDTVGPVLLGLLWSLGGSWTVFLAAAGLALLLLALSFPFFRQPLAADGRAARNM